MNNIISATRNVYPQLDANPALFASLSDEYLALTEEKYGRAEVQRALTNFVNAAHEINPKDSLGNNIEVRFNLGATELNLLTEVQNCLPEGQTQIALLTLLGAACKIYRKSRWHEFCTKDFIALDDAHKQSTLDGLLLWYVHATHHANFQWYRDRFSSSPSEIEEISRFVDSLSKDISFKEEALLTYRLFNAVEGRHIAGIDVSQAYHDVVSELLRRTDQLNLRKRVSRLIDSNNLNVTIPDDASILDLALVEDYLDKALNKPPEGIVVTKTNRFSLEGRTITESVIKLSDFIVGSITILGDDEEADNGVETDNADLGEVTDFGEAPLALVAAEDNSEEFQQGINDILATPEREKRNRLSSDYDGITEREFEVRYGKIGFTLEERKELLPLLGAGTQKGLRLGTIKEVMRHLRDLHSADSIKVKDYKGWEISAAVGLVNIFGSQWSQWLEMQSEFGLSAHDASHWLPDKLSPKRTKGTPANKETGAEAVPSLADFLKKQSWNNNGDITTILADGSRKKGKPRDTEELAIIARNWDCLKGDEKRRSFTDVLSICRSKNYAHQRHEGFAAEAAHHGIKEEEYRDLESIYLSAQDVPEPFNSAKRFQAGNLTGRFLPRDDVRTGFFGQYVNCCQRFGGAGHDAAVATVADQHSQLFVVEDEKGNIIGGAMVWKRIETAPDHPKEFVASACYDSVEIKGITTEIDVVKEEFLTPEIKERQKKNVIIYQALASWLTQECGFHRVTMATSYNTLDKDYLQSLQRLDSAQIVPLPEAYAGRYTDSRNQYLVAQSSTPYLLTKDELRPNIWVRAKDISKSKKDEAAMQKIAELVYPDGFQYADKIEGSCQTTYVLLHDTPYVSKKSGVVGYAVLDDDERCVADIAVDPTCRDGALKLLNKVLKHCSDAGGTWSAHARESSTLKLLKAAHKRGLISLQILDDPNQLAEEDVAHAVAFEVLPRERIAIQPLPIRTFVREQILPSGISPT